MSKEDKYLDCRHLVRANPVGYGWCEKYDRLVVIRWELGKVCCCEMDEDCEGSE